MSKSLKNFITIRQALVTHTARQIRFCFLLHKYNATMDYGDSTMNQAIIIEKIFVEFFHNIKAVLRRISTSNIQYIDTKGMIFIIYFYIFNIYVHCIYNERSRDIINFTKYKRNRKISIT